MALNKLFLVSLNSLKLGVWQMLLYSTCVELINQTSSFRPFNDTRKSYVEPYTNKFWSSRIFGDFTCKNLLATKIICWLQFIIITAQYPMLLEWTAATNWCRVINYKHLFCKYYLIPSKYKITATTFDVCMGQM